MHRYVDGLPLKTRMMSFENHRNCFSVTAFKECEAMRMNMTESNIIFLNRLTTMSSSWVAGSWPSVFLSVKMDKTPIYKLVLRNFIFFQNQISIILQLTQDMHH